MPSTRRKRDSGYCEELREVLANMLGDRSDTRAGLMFGFPAFYAAGKLVACVYGAASGSACRPRTRVAPAARRAAHSSRTGRADARVVLLEPTVAGDLRDETAVPEEAITRAKRDARRSSGWAHRAVADGRRAGAC